MAQEFMTELETKQHEVLLSVKAYLTDRTEIRNKDFVPMMADIMAAIKAYDNKKYGTKRE